MRASYYSEESGISVGGNPVGVNPCYQNCISNSNRPLEESPNDKHWKCSQECNNGNAHTTGEGKTATTPDNQRGVSREYVECAKLCKYHRSPQKKKSCKAKCWVEEEAETPPSVYISDMGLSAV